MNNEAKIVGNHIRIARLNKGLTQEELAEACDVSTKYISALEVWQIKWKCRTNNKNL